MGTALPNIYDREWCRRKGREDPGSYSTACTGYLDTFYVSFYVSRYSTVPILGREACEELSLIKRVDIDTWQWNIQRQRKNWYPNTHQSSMDSVSLMENITFTQTPTLHQSYMDVEKYHLQLWTDWKSHLIACCKLMWLQKRLSPHHG